MEKKKKSHSKEDNSNRLIDYLQNPYAPKCLPQVSKHQRILSLSKKRLLRPLNDQFSQEKLISNINHPSFIDKSKLELFKYKKESEKSAIDAILEPLNITEASNSVHLPEITFKLTQRGDRNQLSLFQDKKRIHQRARSKISTATSWYPSSPRDISPIIIANQRIKTSNNIEEKFEGSPQPISRPSTSAILIKKNEFVRDNENFKSNPDLGGDFEKFRNSSPKFAENPKKPGKKVQTPSRKVKKLKISQINPQRENNLNTILLNRGSYNFSLMMQEYTRRQGYEENSKIFVLTGQHDFIRRALNVRGWIENRHGTSRAFHLKWCYNDSDQDYKDLKLGQFYNHFLNNRELTTKSGLLRSLRNLIEYGVNIDDFFPRCYDMGDNTQMNEFKNDYQRTAIFSLLHKQVSGQFIKQDCLDLAIKYSEVLIQEVENKCEKNTKIAKFELKPDDLNKILDEATNKEQIFLPCNKEIFNKCSGIIKKIQSIFPQSFIDGNHNIWIIKPGQNSKGSGIRCMTDLQDIIECGMGMQSRIVQKYIENPLLVPTSSGLCKFDMRQWVLVTNFDPLTVYFYNSCYLRLCQQPFSLKSLDPFIHLANYSIQKDIAKSAEDTVWELSKLVLLLDSKGISWEKYILPKIHNIIIRTLKSVSEVIVSRPECFELYGFDIMIDESFKPWLLEVNLSPACSERTNWLSGMLDSMGEGLLRIVLDGQQKECLYDENEVLKGELKGNTQEWVFLYKALVSSYDQETLSMRGDLEICGEKFNVNKEKQKEKKFLMQRAALIIQKKTKKFLVKVREERERLFNNVLTIQAWVRRKLANDEKVHEQQIISAIKIQSLFRILSAKKTLNELKLIKAVKKVQASMRGCKSRLKYKKLLENKACLKIQAYLRHKIAKDIARQKQYFKMSIIKIQKFLKKKYHRRMKKAENIQRLWRGYKGRQKWINEYNFQKNVKMIKAWIKSCLARNDVSNLKAIKSKAFIKNFISFNLALKSMAFYKQNNAAIIIQKYIRKILAVKTLKNLKNEKKGMIEAIKSIQKHMRGLKSRMKYEHLKKIKFSIVIQKFYRGYKARKYYKIIALVRKSAITIQRFFKGYKARKKYLSIKKIQLEEKEKKEKAFRLKKEQELKAQRAAERLYNNLRTIEFQAPILNRVDIEKTLGKNMKFENFKGNSEKNYDESSLGKSLGTKKNSNEETPMKDSKFYMLQDISVQKIKSKSRKKQRKNSPYEVIYTKW